MKRLTLISLLTFLILLIPNSVLAATTYLDQNDQTLTAQTTLPFPTGTGTIELGTPGQTTSYLVEQDETGSLETVYMVNGNVNLIVNHGFTNYQEAAAYLTINGQFQIPGTASLSFYRSTITSKETTLVINSPATAITGSASTNSMGEVNFISTSVSTDPVNSNGIVIGPGQNQTGGVINALGGSLSVENPSDNFTSNILGTNGTNDCVINLSSNCYIGVYGLIGGSLTPGSGNNYNVSLKDNANLDTFGIGVLNNIPTANPDGTPLNGIISLFNADNNFQTTVYGTTVINESGGYKHVDSLTIPNGSVLTIPEEVTISFEDEATLTVNGTLINNGGITLLQNTTVSGNGTIENNLEILCCNTTMVTFQGSLINNGDFYYSVGDGFEMPANFSGMASKELDYFAYASLPSTATTTFNINPFGDPDNLEVDVYNPDFGWIEDKDLIDAQIIMNEETKMPLLQIEVNDAYIDNPYWSFAPFYFYVYEVNQGQSILNSFYTFDIKDMTAEPIYLAPWSGIDVSKDSNSSIFYISTETGSVTDNGSTMSVSSQPFLYPFVFISLNPQTGTVNGFYQVNPIPIDLNFVSPLSNPNRYSLNLPANQASYPITVENSISNPQGWSIESISYNQTSIVNTSPLGTKDSQLATLTNISDSGEQFTLNTVGEQGAGTLTFSVKYNGPDGIGTITNKRGSYFGFGAVDLTGLSFGPGSQNTLKPVGLDAFQTLGGVFYTKLFHLFDSELPDVTLYAQSPINGKTDNVVNFARYVNAVNNGDSYEEAIAQGRYVFKSTNPDVIDYNPDTLTFEFGGSLGTANIYIESSDGTLSSLNAPTDQIGYLPVTVEGNVPVEEINLSTDILYLTTQPGGTTSANLTYTTFPINATGEPAWSSDAESVATITTNPDGSVTVNAVSQGIAYVTCQIDDVTATCKVIVSDRNIICDDIIVEGNGSPDYFNVNIINLQSNPALGLTTPVVRAEMFAASTDDADGNILDINAKRLTNIDGTNDWTIGPIPVNNNTPNNWFFYATNINVMIYASTDINTNGNYVGYSLYSWVDNYPKDASLNYVGVVEGEFNKPSISSGITGTTGLNKPMTGLRISSTIPDVQIESNMHYKNRGWFNWDNGETVWYNDGAYAGNWRSATDSLVASPIEAYQFRLVGDNAQNYELQFRGHVQNLGWQDWQSTSNPNAILGTTGQNLNLEACCFRLVPKGTPLPSDNEFN